jgi:uncharacterized protein YjbJ (UPF0337 family)
MGAKTDQFVGRAKQGFGAITGKKKTREEGEVQEQEGKIEGKIDTAVDKTEDALEGVKRGLTHK